MPICGLYYKQVTIVIYNRNDSGQYYKTTITIVIDDLSLSDASKVMLQIVASLIDAARGVIYDRHLFIVQATGQAFWYN
jgi:hypothetical protein